MAKKLSQAGQRHQEMSELRRSLTEQAQIRGEVNMVKEYIYTPFNQLPTSTQLKLNASSGIGEEFTRIALLTKNHTRVFDDTVDGITRGQDMYGNHFMEVDGFTVKCKVELLSCNRSQWTPL